MTSDENFNLYKGTKSMKIQKTFGIFSHFKYFLKDNWLFKAKMTTICGIYNFFIYILLLDRGKSMKYHKRENGDGEEMEIYCCKVIRLHTRSGLMLLEQTVIS